MGSGTSLRIGMASTTREDVDKILTRERGTTPDVRIAISDRRKEIIALLRGFRSTSYYFGRVGQGWYGLTPDDRPITTLDTGIEEIYAFDLEYK